MNQSAKKLFIILFAILYTCVCGVSMLHAIKFFGLANNSLLSIILAVTFEIGQAAVLFSILTGNGGKRTFIPWALMVILTSVQIIGNVFSSYEYLIVHSSESLRFFKEPIFIWTDIADDKCNVILSYLMGGILPVVALLLTSMVTNYINTDDKVSVPEPEPLPEQPTPSIGDYASNIIDKLKNRHTEVEEPKEPEEEVIEQPEEEVPEQPEEEVVEESEEEVPEQPIETINGVKDVKLPSHFVNL